MVRFRKNFRNLIQINFFTTFQMKSIHNAFGLDEKLLRALKKFFFLFIREKIKIFLIKYEPSV